eukprot:5569640-Pyramimonas_sp.AAC.1
MRDSAIGVLDRRGETWLIDRSEENVRGDQGNWMAAMGNAMADQVLNLIHLAKAPAAEGWAGEDGEGENEGAGESDEREMIWAGRV